MDGTGSTSMLGGSMRFVRSFEGVLGPAWSPCSSRAIRQLSTRKRQAHPCLDGPGRAGRGPARRHGHDDQPHAGQRADGGHRHRWPFRVAHRPSRHLHAPGHAPGLQDGGADEPGRERERQAVGRVADPGGRRAERRSHRVEPRDPAAVDERRTLVHAPKRNVEEHRQQRAGALQLRDAGARRAVAEPGNTELARSAASP